MGRIADGTAGRREGTRREGPRKTQGGGAAAKERNRSSRKGAKEEKNTKKSMDHRSAWMNRDGSGRGRLRDRQDLQDWWGREKDSPNGLNYKRGGEKRMDHRSAWMNRDGSGRGCLRGEALGGRGRLPAEAGTTNWGANASERVWRLAGKGSAGLVGKGKEQP